MRKVLFIDRDGVINVDKIGDYITSWEDFRFEEGALDALRILSNYGYDMVIISNQAGIGDGVFTEEALQDIHENMMNLFETEKVRVLDAYYCLHGKEEGCDCRKPEPGLFEMAAQKWEYDPEETFYIGDKASDMTAGKRAGLKTIFVRTGHGQFDEAKLNEESQPDFIVDSLRAAVEVLKP